MPQAAAARLPAETVFTLRTAPIPPRNHAFCPQARVHDSTLLLFPKSMSALLGLPFFMDPAKADGRKTSNDHVLKVSGRFNAANKAPRIPNLNRYLHYKQPFASPFTQSILDI